MSLNRALDITRFDGRIIDGLKFCGLVYDLFDQVKNSPNGNERLRLRRDAADKKLLEELLPLARFVQQRYWIGRRMKVRWFSGNQPYDALLYTTGDFVRVGVDLRRMFVEITTSAHQKDYLRRERLHQSGGSFGVRGLSRDARTKQVISAPVGYRQDELIEDLTSQISERLKDKVAKGYPAAETVLIVNCVTDTVLTQSEWEQALERVRRAFPDLPFREVLAIDALKGKSERI